MNRKKKTTIIILLVTLVLVITFGNILLGSKLTWLATIINIPIGYLIGTVICEEVK